MVFPTHSSITLDAIGELSVKPPVESPSPEREQALYTALARLTIQQQRSLANFFGLAAFQPQANGRRSWRAASTHHKAEWERRKKGLAELRCDERLREVMQS